MDPFSDSCPCWTAEESSRPRAYFLILSIEAIDISWTDSAEATHQYCVTVVWVDTSVFLPCFFQWPFTITKLPNWIKWVKIPRLSKYTKGFNNGRLDKRSRMNLYNYFHYCYGVDVRRTGVWFPAGARDFFLHVFQQDLGSPSFLPSGERELFLRGYSSRDVKLTNLHSPRLHGV